jgi:phosphoglycolate phosphatase
MRSDPHYPGKTPMLSASSAASQLAIFDFDGTIADSLTDVLAMYNVVAQQMGFSMVSDDQVPHLRRLGPREVAKELKVPFWRVPQATAAVRKMMHARMEYLRPFEGMVEMLHELWQRGCKTAIVSSNAYENVSAFLARHGIDRFEHVSCGVGLFGKASRLKQLTRAPQFAGLNTFYVGDEVRDVAAANTAGLRSVAVSWGYAERDALEAQRPDYLVHGPGELLSVLAPV